MHLDVLPAGTALGHAPTPFPIVRVRAAEALDALNALRTAQGQHSPVLLGDAGEAECLIANRDRRAVAGILTASVDASAVELLERHLESKSERGTRGRRSQGRHTPTTSGDDDAPPFEADGPLPPPHNAPQVLIDHRTGAPKPEVIIGLISSPHSFEAAAHLGYGSFGTCPAPEVHVGLARDWQQRFGARVLAMTPSVIEFEVERPVASREDALALAWVHYRYCPDLVAHLVGSIEGLAATLNGARYWHFWWERPGA